MIGLRYALSDPGVPSESVLAIAARPASASFARSSSCTFKTSNFSASHSVTAYNDTVRGPYSVTEAVMVDRTSRLVFMDVESSLSRSAGNAYGAKSAVDEMQSRKRSLRSCAVIPYGSSGGGLKVIGK